MENGVAMTWMPLNATGKRIGYARVSTSEQKLDMQLDALEQINCDLVFTDHGVSGTKTSRPGLDKALNALERGDVLIVFKLDRLGRSVLHLSDLLTRFKNDGIHFYSMAEGVNTTTSGGRMVFHLFSTIAEFERDLIQERTICGLNAARARGKKLGRCYALTDGAILGAHQKIKQEGITIGEMARRCKVSHVTLTRAFKRLGLSM
jgi:DNA invertase Pin-like site-specific DNA recombinase